MTQEEDRPRFVVHTLDGEWHKGPTKDCPLCKAARNKTKSADKAKRAGRLGGKKSSSRLTPSKTCTKCGAKVGKGNITGLCGRCYKLKRAEGLKEQRVCSNPDCAASIRKDNISGLCKDCYRESDAWTAYKKQKASVPSSATFPVV